MNHSQPKTLYKILQIDGLKLRGKLTVNKIHKFKKESFSKKCLSFLYQLFMLRSGDVELNPGPLTIYKYLIHYFTEKSTHLKLFHMNCQSLLKKKHVLQHMMSDLGDNTIFAFSETWLNEIDDEKAWQLNENLFKTFRCDRKSNETQQGGGVMSIAPKDLNPKLRQDLNKLNPNHFESLWIECNLNTDLSNKRKPSINISSNPHKSRFIDFLEELSDNIGLAIVENKPITLMGIIILTI